MNKLYKALRYGSFIGMGLTAAGFAEPDPPGMDPGTALRSKLIILAICAAVFITTEYLKKHRSYIVKKVK